MKIPYISINYDKYWHQIVIGKGIYEFSKYNKRCIFWKRLFGIGKAWNKEYDEFIKTEARTAFERKLAEVIGYAISTAVVFPETNTLSFVKDFSPELIKLAKEIKD